MPPPPHTVLEVAVAAFGVTAAFLLVGGWVLLRWQHGRHQLLITQALIERGVTRLPDGPPFWVLSLRQGMSILMLGLALTAIGSITWRLASTVPMPSSAVLNIGAGAPDDSPPPLEDRDFSPDEPPPGPGEFQRPEFRRPPRNDADRPRPRRPVPNPAMEKWHRAQLQESVGMVLAGCGSILALLGLLRVSFAFVERRHMLQSAGEVGVRH